MNSYHRRRYDGTRGLRIAVAIGALACLMAGCFDFRTHIYAPNYPVDVIFTNATDITLPPPHWGPTNAPIYRTPFVLTNTFPERWPMTPFVTNYVTNIPCLDVAAVLK